MMPTATKGKRPLRHLTATDKCIAIQRIHDGESKASVARDIGVPESTLRGWCKNEEKLRYMSQQAQDQKPSADKLMDKIVSEAAMAAAAAAEFLGTGPPEKRSKMDPNFSLAMNGKGLKNDYFYKRNSLNALDLTGAHHSPLNGDAYAYSYNSFAKAASNLSAMQNKAKDMKGYDLSLKQDDHGKSDLSMAAISPLTSLSNLSGMGALGQSPLALSFNDIATNLNLLAQLQSNSMASFGNLNGAGGSGVTPLSTRNSRPRSNPNNNNNASCSPRSDIMDRHGGGGQNSLTVKNLAKLQQRSPSLNVNDLGLSLSNMQDSNNNTHSGGKSKTSSAKATTNGSNNPVDDPLWYWLKSQQAMMGINSLYSALPRTSSPVSNSRNAAAPQPSPTPTTPNPTVPSPQNSGQSKSGIGGAANPSFDYHLLNAMLPNSLAGLSDPKALTSSPFFWQWYKTIGANLMKGQQQQQQQNNHPKDGRNNNTISINANLNYLSPTGSNKTGGSSPYNNILFSQLTKNSGSGDPMKSEPEDLSGGHPHHSLPNHHQLFNDNDDDEDHHHHHRSRRPMSNRSGHDDDDELQHQRPLDDDVEEVIAKRTSIPSDKIVGGSGNNNDNEANPMMMTSSDRSSNNAADMSGGSSEVRNAPMSRTPSPNPAKCTTNVLELMNPGASPLNSLLKPISAAASDAAMSHSSTHSSSTNSTTMLTEAPNSPQSPVVAEETSSNDSSHNHPHNGLHHLQQQLKSPTKVRAVLDNFLYNNINNNNNGLPEDVTTNGENAENEHNNNIDIRNNNALPPMSSIEAFEYGDKFLKWLESCSDPSITAMQVMQFRYLLQSVKTSANRAANNNTNGTSQANDNTSGGGGGGGYHNNHRETGGGGPVEFMAVKREVVAGMADERSKIRRRK